MGEAAVQKEIAGVASEVNDYVACWKVDVSCSVSKGIQGHRPGISFHELLGRFLVFEDLAVVLVP